MEIWAVKLRFFFIYENMLKSIATALSECTKITKTRQATTQTTLFLISLTFLAMIEERTEHRLKKKEYICKKMLY